jgi:MbtH protein
MEGKPLSTCEDSDDRVYTVVMNHEEQYSIWPHDRPAPKGWRSAGIIGSKSACLEYIDAVWTDLRPASLRRRMDSGKR